MSEPDSTPDFSIVSRPILTDEDADQALFLLSWMATQEDAAAARRKQQQAQQILQDTATFQIQVEKATFTFAEVRKSLDTALKAYAEAQRSRLFVKSQTASFLHGKIQERKQSASVSLAQGVTPEEVIPRLVDQPRYIRTKQELDFPALLSDRRKNLITDAQLASWGLVYDPGEGPKNVSISLK